MLNSAEINLLMPLIDAGVRGTGLQVFAGGGGLTLHSALTKLQTMLKDATKRENEVKANGKDQHND